MNHQIPEGMRPAFERTAHPFHMWDGITSTPDALSSVLQDLKEVVREAVPSINQTTKVHLLGCGSSYFSAIAGTYFMHQVAGMATEAHEAWEFVSYPIAGLENSTMVAISHTGGTPVVIDALNLVKNHEVVTVGLTDVADSPLAQNTSYVLLGREGREPSIPKTRSYAASLLKHYLLATELGAFKGKDVSLFRQALLDSSAKTKEMLQKSEPLAKQLGLTRGRRSRIFLLGAGPNSATAYEGALKLQETVQIAANGWELEEGMHGPWVSIEEGDLVIVIAVEGPSLNKAKGFVSSIHSIGAEVWAITDQPEGVMGADYETYIPSDVPECVTPLYAILPIYQFAYELALSRGIQPDSMRLTDERYLDTRLRLPR